MGSVLSKNLHSKGKMVDAKYCKQRKFSAINIKEVCMGIVLILLLFNLPSTEAKRRPKYDEIERIYNDTHSVFVKCKLCPKGSGLSVECGTSVSFSKEIKCVPCSEGKYSGIIGPYVCKQCCVCDKNQEVSGECTREQDGTVCGNCKAGYYKAVTGDCHECSWCCGGLEDPQRMPDCKGMDERKQCQKTWDPYKCAPSTPATTHKNTTRSTAEPTLETSKEESGRVSSKNLGYLGFLALPIVVILVLRLAPWKWRQLCLRMKLNCELRGASAESGEFNVEVRDCDSGHRDLSNESTVAQGNGDGQISVSASDSGIDADISLGQDLEDTQVHLSEEPSPRSVRRNLLDEKVANLPLQVHRHICADLNDTSSDLVKDYRDFGENLGLEQWELKALQREKNPAEHVIQKFCSVTDGRVRTFVEHMEAMERQDVIDVIHDWMNDRCPFESE